MISIIISSANSKQLQEVSQNVAQTIGVPYEIISLNNADGRMGICEVYNKGTAKATYDLLCFMHEDLLFKTKDWGRIVQTCFDNNEKLGLIGVAGSTYKALCPSSWFSFLEQANRINIIQRFKYKLAEPLLVYNNPANEKLSIVSAVDGVWFCTRKSIAEQVRFDDNMLKGFHGYDIDFSLNVGLNWDVGVSYEVLIDHFSEGRYDKNWVASTLLIHEKWNHLLPAKKGLSLTQEESQICEKQAFIFLTEKMSDFGYSKKEMYKVLLENRLYKVLGWRTFFSLHNRVYKLKINKQPGNT